MGRGGGLQMIGFSWTHMGAWQTVALFCWTHCAVDLEKQSLLTEGQVNVTLARQLGIKPISLL